MRSLAGLKKLVTVTAMAAVFCALPLTMGLGIKAAVSEAATGTLTATPTFEAMGLVWTGSGASSSNPERASVQYRVSGGTWKQGLDLWYDARNGQYRGSVVHLKPGTTYEFWVQRAGTTAEATATRSTWSENFPIAQTVVLPTTSTSTLNITQSGTPSGYVLYTHAEGGSATIDAANVDYCVKITAAYVIVSGITCTNARIDGIRLETGAHDVVIDNNVIRNWGRPDTARGSHNGVTFGINNDAGIHVRWRIDGVDRLVIQGNRIGPPRYTSNHWQPHPAGPGGIVFENCAGSTTAERNRPNCGSNHVIRYNDVVGDSTHYFMDAIGGGDNFSSTGFPHADSDIYGNRIRYVWDDAIEAEGGNRNVRIWGNYVDEAYVSIATAATHTGPLYIFRNVTDRSRMNDDQSNDTVEHGPFGKLGDNAGYGGGRRYYFHNTMLQQPAPSGQSSLRGHGGGPAGGSSERPMVEVWSRNNIWHTHRDSDATYYSQHSGTGRNNLDYDLHNGRIILAGTTNVVGSHRRVGSPTYAPGHGAASGDGGSYSLQPGTIGYDHGEVLPNFSDGYTGAAPDMGAHEAGTPRMQFGPDAYLAPTLPLAINAGGPAVGSYIADAYVVGGASATNWTGAIDTSGVTNPAPEAVYQTERYGAMTYTIPGLIPGASYDVRLHFAENYFAASGQRRLDVTANGVLVLDEFDVFVAAGGAHRAVVREFEVAANAAGELVLAFTATVNQPMVNGIEVAEVAGSATCGDGIVTAPEVCDDGNTTSGDGCSATCQFEGLVGPVSINAGGPAVGSYIADAGFTGGAVANNWTGAINLTGVHGAAPEAVYQPERYGPMSYTIGGLAAGAHYDVRLHFAENYFGAANQRKFNVAINGTPVLTDFDVFAAAGAAHKAVVREFDVLASSTGRIVVDFTNGTANQALVNGVQVLADCTGWKHQINAGGPGITPFVADVNFSGGSTATNWTGAIDMSGVTNPAPQAVYHTERYGSTPITYTISNLTSATQYRVRLHFAENYYSAANQRKFNVALNGTTVLSDFDVFAAAGAAHKAVVREFTVTANGSGQVVVAFTNVLEKALINGIEVFPGCSP
jgi:cysteine-rich repeat protein